MMWVSSYSCIRHGIISWVSGSQARRGHSPVLVGTLGWGLDLKGASCESDVGHGSSYVAANFSQQQCGRCIYLGPCWENTEEKPVFHRWNSHGWVCPEEPWGWWPLCFYQEGLFLTLQPGGPFCHYLTFSYKSPSTGIPLFDGSCHCGQVIWYSNLGNDGCICIVVSDCLTNGLLALCAWAAHHRRGKTWVDGSIW